MLRFECDYGEGAHPKILERLLETNLEQTPGYGKDEHCERAKTLIRQACGLPQSTIEFVTGGTQGQPDRHCRHFKALSGGGLR